MLVYISQAIAIAVNVVRHDGLCPGTELGQIAGRLAGDAAGQGIGEILILLMGGAVLFGEVFADRFIVKGNHKGYRGAGTLHDIVEIGRGWTARQGL